MEVEMHGRGARGKTKPQAWERDSGDALAGTS